jgi:hypothetical protein
MSQGRAIRPGMSFAVASSAWASMSQTKTLAPVAANARANSRPMPAAPAVIRTRCGIVPPVMHLRRSACVKASKPSQRIFVECRAACGARVAAAGAEHRDSPAQCGSGK